MNWRRSCILALGVLLVCANRAFSTSYDLTSLGNSGYEADLVHSQWTVTQPNSSYLPAVPVNPTINPLNPLLSNGSTLPALVAPVGNNFVGAINDTLNGDQKGKLAHIVLPGTFNVGDTFTVTVWANRGRLGSNSNTNSDFATVGASSQPTLDVRLLGFNSATAPTVTSADNWNATIRLNSLNSFTNWPTTGAGVGQWSFQTFTFTNTFATGPLTYIALTVAGQNNNHDQYVAWDIGPGAPAPEPSSCVLAGLGVIGFATGVRLRRRKAS
jgi:hypothetical protein